MSERDAAQVPTRPRQIIMRDRFSQDKIASGTTGKCKSEFPFAANHFTTASSTTVPHTCFLHRD